MNPRELILKKRDGGELDDEEIRIFMDGYMHGDVSEAQMSAFLMAVFHAGMSFRETADLTRIFLDSGTRIDLSRIGGRKVDKHSTGGVGDKTSLLLAPIVAAAGVPVPMISGRSLAHTGGTLDKLESIPGFVTDLDAARFTEILLTTGAVMAGQSETLAPLDRRVYALRDVTGTVEILPFIAASIMSKKIAGGADALILDVKTGAGAFMESEKQANELSALLCGIGGHFGLQTRGFITDMNEPLGRAIGVWLEVAEVIDCLRGIPSPDLMEVTIALAGAMIAEGGKAADDEEGRKTARELLTSGAAYLKFLELVRAHGGDTGYIEEPLRYPSASSTAEVSAPADGYVAGINARMLGELALELGAGRKVAGAGVDATAGIVLSKKSGDRVQRDEPLCRLYSSTRAAPALLRETALRAFRIAVAPSASRSRILRSFDAAGTLLSNAGAWG